MKRTVLLAAMVALVAVPALADITPMPVPDGTTLNHRTIDLGNGPDPRASTIVYADTSTSGFFYGGASTGAVADDIHIAGPGVLTAATFAYYGTASLTTAGTFTATVAFYGNTAGDGAFGPLLGSFTVTGLADAGAWAIGVAGLNIAVPADFWFEVNYTGSAATTGPLMTGDPGGYIGYSHDVFEQNGSLYWFGGSPWADFYHLCWVPEPGTIGLLALSGLLVLARRR